MGVSDHPAYESEQEHLKGTLHHVRRQLRVLAATTKLEYVDAESGDEDVEESLHAVQAAGEALESMREDAVARLQVATREPYFGRIDFQEAGSGAGQSGTNGGKPQPLYIGKFGVEESGSHRPLVIDWRAPVASLFYAAMDDIEGNVAYDAPEGRITGRLWLKRNLHVRRAALQHIADAYVLDESTHGSAPIGDPYLLYRLQESRDNRLRDIVSTIQSQQNAIIRADQDRPLIIQGVAGSGKTSVALHRLAYLVYTYRDRMAAEGMIIFAPNRMFLDYIAGVLPELGVGGIRQVTFAEWAIALIDERVALADPGPRLARYFDPSTDPEDDDEAPGRFKGSLHFRDILDRALVRYKATIVPRADLELWPGCRVRHREIHEWFHQRYALHPILTRRDRVYARLRNWARSQVEPYGDTEQGRRLRQKAQSALAQYIGLWPDHTTLSLYREILGLGPPRGKRPADVGSPDLPFSVRRDARETLKRRTVAPEDLAPLVYLQERLRGLSENKAMDHIVIDEAQDFSPFQVELLRQISRNGSMTLLGDLAQGIHSYAGINDWTEHSALFPPDSVQFHVLQQSYRSTYEIITFANQVLRRMDHAATLALPVFRAGEPVRLQVVAEAEHLPTVVAEVQRLRQTHSAMAVVTRTAVGAEAIHAHLLQGGLKANLVRTGEQHYRGGVSVMPGYLAKGLEFDAVVLPDADAWHYRSNRRDARLLYVALTRALHELVVLYSGELTPLLQPEESPELRPEE